MNVTAMPALAAARAQARRWAWQRLSALVLAACVVVHLVVIVYATRGGLSAAEILSRTRGSWTFAVFYAVFVLAAAVHAPIGLMRIVEEWWGVPPRMAGAAGAALGLLMLVLGGRAVWAVVVPA